MCQATVDLDDIHDDCVDTRGIRSHPYSHLGSPDQSISINFLPEQSVQVTFIVEHFQASSSIPASIPPEFPFLNFFRNNISAFNYNHPTYFQILDTPYNPTTNMQFSTQAIIALTTFLSLGINASPIQVRSDCVAADNAPAGSQAQKDALAACALKDQVAAGNPSAAATTGSSTSNPFDSNGCLTTCGPPSQFYKPGCHCENTLFTSKQKRDAPVEIRSDCVAADNAPAGSQAQKDALAACALNDQVTGGNSSSASDPAAGAFDADGCITTCGPPSEFYKPGCHCENTLFTN
ncbi:MAG: hypothetical protein HETSPECPRED_006597 [Heterodermia speciosa]|uniref:Uncharacterized protein n=1 Tax=Heterodermia speciosa TaxID=116794 RepID=A0A8H3FN13_9LECA|nr:MAG: hypothetical protein HETSPECPRED_006597 [Heterodermia speciosa]